VKLHRVAIALIALQFLSAPAALAATAKPTPKTTLVKKATTSKKVSDAKKSTTKSTVKKSTAAKTKTTTTKKTASTKKTTSAKKTLAIKKTATVHKYVYHAPVRKAVTPTPALKWPPKGFTSVGTAYARVPTGTELVGILSAMKDSATPVKSCSIDPNKPNTPALSCAAILVGSTERCTWWKITSTITGIDPSNPTNRVTIGQITDVEAGAAAKTIQTIFLISPVPLQTGVRFGSIQALCGIGPATDPVPSSTFVPDPSYTPAPTTSPTPSDSPTATNP
jgi:hypothetical protein